MAANPLKYRLKYVGGPTIESVRYLHVKDGVNDRTFYTETVAEIEAMTFTSNGNAQDIVIESVPLFVAEIITNPTINSVTGHLSTHRDNWVDWKSHFSFGDYYGSTPIFNVRLGGQFHVRDGNYHTLNGIYRGLRNVKSWDKGLFKDYFNGTDGDQNIVGLKETFKDNTALTDLQVGLLQFLPHLESIYQCWMNTGITELRSGVFAYQNKIAETEGAFENTPITSIPARLIAIG